MEIISINADNKVFAVRHGSHDASCKNKPALQFVTIQFFPGILFRNFIVDKHFADFMESFRFEPYISLRIKLLLSDLLILILLIKVEVMIELYQLCIYNSLLVKKIIKSTEVDNHFSGN